MEKIKTYTIAHPDGEEIITGTDLKTLMESICDDNGQLDEDFVEEGETIEYKIIVQKKYTAEEIDALPEYDGH